MQPLMDNIYTCSTQVHSNKNPSVNSPRKIHPYVERSVSAGQNNCNSFFDLFVCFFCLFIIAGA